MTEYLHNDEIFIKYLDGEMTQEEKTSFESALQHDASFKEKWQRFQITMQAVRQMGTVEKLTSIHKEMMTERVAPSGSVVNMGKVLRYGIGVAAAFILFIGIRFFSADTITPNKLFDEAFVDYKVAPTRGSGQSSAIENLYEGNNFVAIMTEAAKARGKFSQEDSLLAGLSFLKTNHIDSAIQWFQPLSIQSPYREDAEFYLALSYLKNKNIDEALTLIKHIHTTATHPYREQFSEIFIDKLESLKR